MSLSASSSRFNGSYELPVPYVSYSLSGCLLDSATAVEKEVARADDGSACPGCRTHGQARRHAALAAAKRGRVALGPGRSPSARVGDMREKSDPLVTLLYELFTERAVLDTASLS